MDRHRNIQTDIETDIHTDRHTSRMSTLMTDKFYVVSNPIKRLIQDQKKTTGRKGIRTVKNGGMVKVGTG